MNILLWVPESGPIRPERFELVETNERLPALQQHGRFQR
jgi:hypothetical protein